MNIIFKTLKPTGDGIPFVLNVKNGRSLPLKEGYYFGKYKTKAGKLLAYRIYKGTEDDFYKWKWLFPTFGREKEEKVVAKYDSYYCCDYEGEGGCYKCKEKECQWYSKVTETEGIPYPTIKSLFLKTGIIKRA